MKNTSNIQMWQPDWNHPTWTYMTDDLRPGATFTHQLVPELADNVFLHGTVEATDVPVSTVAGDFEHAVQIGYVIDYGWSEGTDPEGQPIGQFRSETRGHVHYVPDVGPVESLEDFLPFVEVDCGTQECPAEWTDLLGVSIATISLSLSQRPVGVEAVTWGRLKALYQ